LELAPLPEELVRCAVPLALTAPAEQHAAALRDLSKLPVALEADPRGWVLRQLEQLGPLARRLPGAWRGLLVPTLLSQRGGASATLGVLERLAKHVTGPRSLELLRRVVTQRGAGAVDVLRGLFARGCSEGQIGSLEEEAELLDEFLERFPFAAPEAYAAYRAASRAEGEGGPDVEALLAELRELGEAVVAGEVSEAQAEHALFPAVLYHVFPPALSVGRERYAWLYRARADHPEHLAAWVERHGPPPSEPLRLGRGGYRLREGAVLDAAPWALLAKTVARVHEEPGPGPAPHVLGHALLDAWGAGKLGQEETRGELLELLYRAHQEGGAELPSFALEPRVLLAYREFLADSCKELVQEGLRAARQEEPERYQRVVAHRLAPRRRVGRGLLRAVRATVAAHAAGELERERALERLARQLAGFCCDEGARAALLTTPPADLLGALRALEPAEVEVRLGEEHARLLADLCGQDLAAMQRELFGAEGEEGKLEHAEDVEGERTEVRVEVTKRRAHVPIGFCEGVCTASDAQLWDDPRFLQAILWGPEGIALGGVHLLIEGEGLILPGINPSLRLLQEVGDEAVLEALLGWAARLARAWGLREVCVPTHPGIASNRARLRELLRASSAPLRATGGVAFSHSPYRYTVDEVRVVWSAATDVGGVD
ncbi:MAG TPA: hypothetical protein DEA08_04035, partial [Planctomycetes bacterium]|nr:hypothetical protein [Planctomycetota bacterium]